VAAGQDLDRLGEVGVASHLTVMLRVGPDEIGQHTSISGVRFGPELEWRSR